MAVCKKCGSIVNPSDKRCPNCKAPIKKSFDFKSFLKRSVKTDDFTGACSYVDINQNKIFAALCYIPLLCLIPIIAKLKKSAFVKFHANQGLLTFGIIAIVTLLHVLSLFLIVIPILGPIAAYLLAIIFYAIRILVTLLIIIGIFNSLTGKAKELPLIGKIRLF